MIIRFGRFMSRILGTYTPPTIALDFLLMESGDYLLQEDNTSRFELE